MADLRVDHLNIYPVKALGAWSVDEARVTGLGFDGDRRWMLIDQAGVFISQRKHPVLGQCAVSVEGDGIVISRGGDGISLPVTLPEGPRVDVEIWSDTVRAVEGPPEASKWFSELVGSPCRVVFQPDEAVRRVNPRFAEDPAFTSFTDGFPILLAHQSSLDDLNRRMDGPVPMSRFRPNIVISGGAPFEEDAWGRVAIGSAEIRGVKPCSRCVVTTIDMPSLTMHKEPLKTLATFRRFGRNVYFAENFVVARPGHMRVGDRAAIVTRRTPEEVARSRS